MKKYGKCIALLMCLLLVAGFLFGCSGNQANEAVSNNEPVNNNEPESEKGVKEEVIIGVVQNPTNLDPHQNTANASRVITHCMYNSLTFMDTENKKLIPSLAESWEISAENEYIFKLRKGVKFHDGRDMTSKDVKYSLERAASMPAGSSYVSSIEKIDIVDDYTIRITLDAPSATILNSLSHCVTSIIPEGSGDTAADKPVGTGPYKYVEWLTDNYVLLERFDDYFEGAKPTKYIRFRIIPDHAARNLALEAGDIDVSHNVSGAADYSNLLDRDDINVTRTRSVITEYLAMQVEKPPFNDIHARKAVAHALDKDTYINSAFAVPYNNAKSILTSDVFGYNDNIKTYEYNIDKAKEELAKSKYPNGFEFNCYTTRSRSKYIELLQHNLSEVGIIMNVEYVENVQSQCKPGYTGAHITSISYPELDPDTIYRYLHSSTKGAGGNLTWYENARVDELLEKSRTEIDTEKRKAIFYEIQDIIAEDLPIIPLHNSVVAVGAVKNAHNAEVHPTTVPYYYNVYVEN